MPVFPPRNIFATLVPRGPIQKLFGLVAHLERPVACVANRGTGKRWWLKVGEKKEETAPKEIALVLRGVNQDWIGVKKAVGQSNCGQRRFLPAYVFLCFARLVWRLQLGIVRVVF